MSTVKDFFYNENTFNFSTDSESLLDSAMNVNTYIKAKTILKYLVDDILKHNPNCNLEEATNIAKQNIGYFAGYYSDEVRANVEKYFDTAHPFFGKISEMGVPTYEEALECGQKLITLAEIRNRKIQESFENKAKLNQKLWKKEAKGLKKYLMK